VRAFRRTGASTVTLSFDVAARGDTVSAFAAADFDDDGATELLWGVEGDSDMLVVAEANGTVQWTSGDTPPQVASGPFVGGELARTPTDGPAPLFASMRTASSGLRLAALDPQTGDLTFSPELPRPVSDNVQLRVVDYDGDLRDEVFVTTDRDTGAYQLVYDFFGASTEFTSAVISNEEGATALAYGDLNGDGRDDLVATSLTGFIRAYDVFQGTPLFALPLAPGQVPVAAAIAPLNTTGGPEIVVAASDRVLVFSRDGGGAYTATQTSATTYPNLRDLVVEDIDGDGTFEIFALHDYPGSRVQRLDGNLTPRGAFDIEWPTSSYLLVEESAFDRKNLVLLDNHSTGVVVVDPDSGKEIWRSPALMGTITRGGLHFVELAGERRMTIATTEGVFLTR
jgi:hypothetical protein